MANVDLAGRAIHEDGSPKVGFIVELWETSAWETPGTRTASTTTDSNGNWSFASQDATKTWLVVVLERRDIILDGQDKMQVTDLDVTSDVFADTISEHTSGSGVTVDGLLVKDSAIPITGLDIDGGTDIGAAIADADLIVLDDGAGGTNRKSAMSRVKTYAQGIKLDDFAAPDDNTDLNFSTSLHGLVPKGTNVGDFLKDDGTWDTLASGGAVTRKGGSTTEATTTSTTNANMITVGSLSIAAGVPIRAQYNGRKTSGAAVTVDEALELNSTATQENTFCSAVNQAEDVFYFEDIGPRVTNYQRCGMVFNIDDQPSNPGRLLSQGSTLPIATVTDLDTHGKTLDASVTFGNDEYHIYSWAVA